MAGAEELEDMTRACDCHGGGLRGMVNGTEWVVVVSVVSTGQRAPPRGQASYNRNERQLLDAHVPHACPVNAHTSLTESDTI